jgi:hypothetical protein
LNPHSLTPVPMLLNTGLCFLLKSKLSSLYFILKLQCLPNAYSKGRSTPITVLILYPLLGPVLVCIWFDKYWVTIICTRYLKWWVLFNYEKHNTEEKEPNSVTGYPCYIGQVLKSLNLSTSKYRYIYKI